MGGPDKAIYAYAREDLDAWQETLGRSLPDGCFGENLTTQGLDVNGALIGERWQVGATVVLEVSCPRIPCGTFQGWLARSGWVREFTEAAMPGAYLRVVEPGQLAAGDEVRIVHRPRHDATVSLAFRALTREPDLLPRLLTADALPAEAREAARRRVSR